MLNRALTWIYATSRRRTALHIFFSALTLSLGTLIYVVYRPANILVFEWIAFVGLEDFVATLRSSSVVLAFEPPEWVLYSLPDMLWVVSFGHAIFAVLTGADTGLKGFWVAAITIGAVAIGSEVGQAFGVVPGTFDWWDLLLYGAGILWLIFFTLSEARFRSQPIDKRSDNHE